MRSVEDMADYLRIVAIVVLLIAMALIGGHRLDAKYQEQEQRPTESTSFTH